MFRGEGSSAHFETRLGTGSRGTRILHAIKKQLGASVLYGLINFPSRADTARRHSPGQTPAHPRGYATPRRHLDNDKNNPFLTGWL